MQINPLLLNEEYLRFDLIKPEHFVPAAEIAVKECEEMKRMILSEKNRTFDNTIKVLIDILDKLDQLFMINGLYDLTLRTDNFKAEYEKANEIIDIFYFDDIYLSSDIYKAIIEYSETDDAKQLDIDQKNVLNEYIREFKSMGVSLSVTDKEKLMDIDQELSEFESRFRDNVYQSKWEIVVTNRKDLAGLSDEDISRIQKKSQSGDDIYLIDQRSSTYQPVLNFSNNDKLKKEIYSNNNSIGTLNGFDNRDIVEKIIDLRFKKADLLGYKNYAELSLDEKTAKNPDEVIHFVERLAEKAKKSTDNEFKDLIKLKESFTDRDENKIYNYESSYLKNRLVATRTKFNMDDLKNYFELNNVLEGLFHILNKLYDIKCIKLENIPTIHKDILTYTIVDESGNKLSYIYLDLIARENKDPDGAWFSSLGKDRIGIPLMSIICNFEKENSRVLLSLENLRTLFHEVGHALHCSFNRSRYSTTGYDQIPADLKEFPSTFMEYFVYVEEVLKIIGKHYETDVRIPQNLIEKVIESNSFQTGSECITQSIFSLFDILVHSDKGYIESSDKPSIVELYNNLKKRYNYIEQSEMDNYPFRFSHIFGGFSYEAGCYSYLWSEIYAADAFDQFKNSGELLSSEVGIKFKDLVLAKGNKFNMKEQFKLFKGSDLSEDPLVKNLSS